jgi:hypothetical protein
MSKPSILMESDLENGSVPSYEEAVPPPPYIPKPSVQASTKLEGTYINTLNGDIY